MFAPIVLNTGPAADASLAKNAEQRKAGTMTSVKAECGNVIKEGDVISFSYGIPGVRVDAPVILRNGKLIAITEGHKPAECEIKKLKKYVGNLYIETRVSP